MPTARHPLVRPALGAVSFGLAGSLVVGLGACAPADAPAEAAEAPVLGPEAFRELESPAAAGSGEPHLTAADDGVLLSWLEPEGDTSSSGETTYALRLAHLGAEGWSQPSTVARSTGFFVNWADFPTVEALPDGTLLAHWLQRGGGDTYDYGVRVVRSDDGGATWSEPWTPHEDGTPTEHGFLSFVPTAEGGAALVWLDGRKFAEGRREMTLRARTLGPDGSPGPETLVDDLICDCCQTDAALAADGPVVVYRDRTTEEVRDIYVTRLVDGRWEEGRAVYDDGWVMPACPVNGPAVAARGDDVAVAWFAAPGEEAQVKVAFSRDAGATFGPPVRLDGGAPGGRVDVTLLDDGSALVTWLERVRGADGASTAEIRARRVAPDGTAGLARALARSSDARASGFPRLAPAPGGDLVLAWTDVRDGGSRVRVARFDPTTVPEPGS